MNEQLIDILFDLFELPNVGIRLELLLQMNRIETVDDLWEFEDPRFYEGSPVKNIGSKTFKLFSIARERIVQWSLEA